MNPVHLLAVAALLLVAFLAGALVGTMARVIALRQARRPAVEVAAPAAAATVGPPLVAAPVIVALPVAPAPVPLDPARVPVPDFAAALMALASETPPAGFLETTRQASAPVPLAPSEPTVALPQEPVTDPVAEPMQPAHVAGETTSGIHVAAPRHDGPVVQVEPPVAPQEQRTADVIPFPMPPAEPAAERPADIVIGGERVTIVNASDLAPLEPEDAAVPALDRVEASPESVSQVANDDRFVFAAIGAIPEGPPTVPDTDNRSDTIPIPAIAANEAVEAVLGAALAVPQVVATAPEPPIEEPVSVAPTIEAPEVQAPASEPAAVNVTPAPEQIAEPVPSMEAQVDEDAAMRAIEGSWTPRRPPSRRVARSESAPDGANQAVAASARAVTAARRTAEAVVAEAQVEAGRPAGLDGPRDGRKDDLTHIIGVLPVIETALNTLGIYHFDQLGALTDENIGWIEGHLGVPGRISRELWREQARELAAVLKPRRAAE